MASKYDSDETYCSEAEEDTKGFRKSQRLSQKPARNYKEYIGPQAQKKINVLNSSQLPARAVDGRSCHSMDILEATEMQICSEVLPLNQNAVRSSSQNMAKTLSQKRRGAKRRCEVERESNVRVLTEKNGFASPAKPPITTSAALESTPRENIENMATVPQMQRARKRTQAKRKTQTRKRTPKVKSNSVPHRIRGRPQKQCTATQGLFHGFSLPSAPVTAPAGLNSVRESLLPSIYPPHFIYQLPGAPAAGNAMPPPQADHTEWHSYLTPEFTPSIDLDQLSTSSPSLPESLRYVLETDDIRELLQLDRISYRLTERHVQALAVVLSHPVEFMHQVLDRVCQFSSSTLEQISESLRNLGDEANRGVEQANASSTHVPSPDRLSVIEGSQSPAPRHFMSQTERVQRSQQ